MKNFKCIRHFFDFSTGRIWQGEGHERKEVKKEGSAGGQGQSEEADALRYAKMGEKVSGRGFLALADTADFREVTAAPLILPTGKVKTPAQLEAERAEADYFEGAKLGLQTESLFAPGGKLEVSSDQRDLIVRELIKAAAPDVTDADAFFDRFSREFNTFKAEHGGDPTGKQIEKFQRDWCRDNCGRSDIYADVARLKQELKVKTTIEFTAAQGRKVSDALGRLGYEAARAFNLGDKPLSGLEVAKLFGVDHMDTYSTFASGENVIIVFDPVKKTLTFGDEKPVNFNRLAVLDVKVQRGLTAEPPGYGEQTEVEIAGPRTRHVSEQDSNVAMPVGPSEGAGDTVQYVVKKGDTLTKITREYYGTINVKFALALHDGKELIKPGDVIELPKQFQGKERKKN